MKKLVFMSLAALFITFTSCQAQQTKSPEVSAVKKAIAAFSKAGDENNVKKLEKYTDVNFRVVMNQLFGSKEIAVLDRDAYFTKIKTKEWGGDKRKLTIENVVVNGKTASAKVTFAGTKMTFVSIVTLVQDAAGNWKMLEDNPSIKS